MNHQMPHDMGSPMFLMWLVLFAIIILVASAIWFFSRPVKKESYLAADLMADPAQTLTGKPEASGDVDGSVSSPSDTIFIFPDISHYTRFMTGNEFAFAHAQYIVFSLINAIIRGATKSVELSKLEGDAALFFIDANRLTPSDIRETVFDIFRAFFGEQDRLLAENICTCKACKSIEMLDLKIFVHRGKAARFEFRGSTDHFGTDVIILHRMMKNSVSQHRYVMVTETASSSINLEGIAETFEISENIEHVGNVKASVFPVTDELRDKLAAEYPEKQKGKLLDTLQKLRMNIQALLNALHLSRKKKPV